MALRLPKGGARRAAAIVFVAAVVSPSLAARAEVHTFTGTLGTARIGLTVDIADEKSGGPLQGRSHYFYDRFLKDIPLHGEIGPASTFTEPAGGAFHLHFVGNGSEGSQPLTLYNSIGLAGTWTSGERTLPVTLEGAWSSASNAPLYGDVDGVTDPPAFERKVQAFKNAVLSDDRQAAADWVHYPLALNGGAKPRLIRSKAELIRAWETVFPPAWRRALAATVPHDMFSRDQGAMLGTGIAWFDGSGLKAVNPVR